MAIQATSRVGRNKDAPGRKARRALAAELLESPIVFFNGHDFAPGGKEMDILKEYLANGGFVLAENCCGKARHPGFDREFRALMKYEVESTRIGRPLVVRMALCWWYVRNDNSPV